MIIPLTYADSKQVVLNELSEIAEKIHKRSHKWRKFQPYSLEYTWIIDQITSIVGNLQSKKILDAGGGQGMVQYYLARRGAEMYNVSRPINMASVSNKENIVPGPKLANGKLGPSIHMIAHDMAVVDLEPNSFDGITCISAIEHNPWPHIIKCALNLVKSLKPGAPFVVSVPAGKVRKWYKQGEMKAMPMPLYLFDPNAVNELAKVLEPYATLITKIPTQEVYEKIWSNTHAKLIQTKGTLKYPFLSGGFVFIRK